MASLTITPAIVAPNGVVDVSAAGLTPKIKTRLRWADAVTASANGRASSSGEFGRQGISVGATAMLRTLLVEQQVTGSWVERARADVSIRKPTPTPIPNLQAAIDAAAPGATIDCGGATFRERVFVRKPLRLVNGKLDNTGMSWGLQEGALVVEGAGSDVYVGGFEQWGGPAAGLNIRGDVHRVTVEDSRFHDNVQEGYNIGGAYDVTIRRTRFDHNNVAMTIDPGWEAGGGKARVINGVFEDCEADHNGGPGLWADQWYPSGTPESAKQLNTGYVVRRCRAHDNKGPGIMYEVSHQATIEDNVCWANGFDGVYGAWWPWHAGILVSSSGDVIVRRNVVKDNHGGITVVSQARGLPGYTDRPSDADTKISVSDNDVIMLAGEIGLSWNRDWSASPLLSDTTNGGSGNRYWWPLAENGNWRFGWGDGVSTLAQFSGTRGEEGGRYLTTAEKDAVVAAAGIP